MIEVSMLTTHNSAYFFIRKAAEASFCCGFRSLCRGFVAGILYPVVGCGSGSVWLR